jgi:hypothetical protein
MGGNSLLDCVVWGRLSGQAACAAALTASAKVPSNRIETLMRHLTINVDPKTNVINITVPLDGSGASGAVPAVSAATAAPAAAAPAAAAPAAAAAAAAPAAKKR